MLRERLVGLRYGRYNISKCLTETGGTMVGSHLPRGSHQRRSSTPWPPYQRGRTTRRYTRTRGLPRVGLRLRDRLAFVVVFVSPKGAGRCEGRGCAATERELHEQRQPKGWTMMFVALEFFPSPTLLGSSLALSLARSLISIPSGSLVSLPKQRCFPCFTWKKQVSANKGPRCARQPWPG